MNRAEFVCDGKPIIDKYGRFEFVIPPKCGDFVVHGDCRWKVVEIVHDLQRSWLQVVCHDETPPPPKPAERSGRRSRYVPLPSTETPDGT